MNYSILLFIFLLFPNDPSSSDQAPNVTDEEKKMLIERHNFWRAEVGLDPLEWSDEMAALADDWAQQLKESNCAFKHRPNNKYGENLFWGTSGYYTAGDAVDSWADERKDYNYDSNKCNSGKVCGHYTQIIWKNTTKFGCAKSICNGAVTWVCNDDPPGNYIGQKPY
jgi:pathogenesis-related protein 1